MNLDFDTDALGKFTMPDANFKSACAGYCQMAMKRAGVSRDAQNCILDFLWETFDLISVEAAQKEFENR